MPTISEILARRAAEAKAAAAAAEPTAPPPSPPPKRETIAETADLIESIDRIDPPGKHARAASRSLILKNTPMDKPGPRGQATPVTGPPEERALATTQGETIDITPADADPATTAWHAAMTSLESELVIMRDPQEPEVCWLALRAVDSPKRPPLLLHRLPWTLWDHPQTPRPANEPF